VVALEPPGDTNLVLKRIIALPRETISLTASGIVLNGVVLAMPAALSNVVYCPPDRMPHVQGITPVAFPYPTGNLFVRFDEGRSVSVTPSTSSRNVIAIVA
jgi:hypothetical protein